MRVSRGIGYTSNFIKMKKGQSRIKLRAAIKAQCAEIAEQSMSIVPVDEYELIKTAYVEVKKQGSGYVGEIGYLSPYAVVQHETSWFKHKPGRTWKYLEKPLKAASRWFAHNVAKKYKEMTR
jgi:hypothetical protein